jgi:hypothetical protein
LEHIADVPYVKLKEEKEWRKGWREIKVMRGQGVDRSDDRISLNGIEQSGCYSMIKRPHNGSSVLSF